MLLHDLNCLVSALAEQDPRPAPSVDLHQLEKEIEQERVEMAAATERKRLLRQQRRTGATEGVSCPFISSS